MSRRALIKWIAPALMLIATARPSSGAVPIPLELQQSREEERNRQIQLDAEASLREKVEVGKQRYDERMAFRSAVLEGIQQQAIERRDEVTGKIPPGSKRDEPFDPTNLTLAAVVVAGLVFAGRHVRKAQLEELSLGSPPLELRKAEPEAAPEEPVRQVAEWRQIIRTLNLPSQVALEAQHDTVFMTKGGVERRLQPLAEFADDLLSVRLCLDISDAVGESMKEETIRAHMESLLADAGIPANEESKICLALSIRGTWDQHKSVFEYKAKSAVLETAVLFKENVKDAERRVLWGAEYAGRAAIPELENDLLGVAQVFVELFAGDRITVRTQAQPA